MKYVALLSGGKDSCYNLLHCAQNGYELVAAASLGPADGKEEIDSYLYQTVGQDAIPLVAQALEIPLYREVIRGQAVELGMEYGTRDAKQNNGTIGDETEDLFSLLCSVKTSHPDVQGVSVGAILSNYQRIRVEHVCRRLNLTPLCFLWQRDQAELFTEMVDAGMVAILIKVAGIGLKPNHLGKTLAEMKDTLWKLHDLYGAHICGEGGEYETLTLDCPLFRHRIALTEVETVIHSDHEFATVAFLRVKKAELEPKVEAEYQQARQPPLLDEPFLDAQKAILKSETIKTMVPVLHSSVVQPWSNHPRFPSINVLSFSWLAVSNICVDTDLTNMTFDDEVIQCFRHLQEILESHSLSLSNCVNINVYLSSMDLFPSLNALYTKYFGSSPPARACVAVDLPDQSRIKIDCTAYVEDAKKKREALHVQSVSYWAPANIGPYSQAIVAGEYVHVSGQIGLIPSTMAMSAETSLSLETALAMQHTYRVIKALKEGSGGGWRGGSLLDFYWMVDQQDIQHVKNAIPVADRETPTLFLVVQGLPKGAVIEKQTLYHTGRYWVMEEEDDDTLTLKNDTPTFATGNLGSALSWSFCSLNLAKSSSTTICVRGATPDLSNGYRKIKDSCQLHGKQIWNVRLYYTPSFSRKTFDDICELLFDGKITPITSVPCRYISNIDSDEWDWAMCIFSL